jgi:hypothetical protein
MQGIRIISQEIQGLVRHCYDSGLYEKPEGWSSMNKDADMYFASVSFTINGHDIIRKCQWKPLLDARIT